MMSRRMIDVCARHAVGKLFLLMMTVAVIWVCGMQTARADEIVLNASYNELFVFPTHLETFTIPPGQTIVGATVSGTVFGNPESTLPGGTTLSYLIDGYLVPTVTVASPTAGFIEGSFSFTFPTSELFRFTDGMVVVGNCPLGVGSCNPGAVIEHYTATLTLTTAPAAGAVPEPATVVLFGTGLTAAALSARRRRKR